MVNYPILSISNKTSNDSLEEKPSQIDSYEKWFMNSIKGRTQVINEVILKGNLDYSYKSLSKCFSYHESHLIKKETTEDEKLLELYQLPEYLRGSHDPNKYLILEPSLSVSFDISVYWGEIILKKYSKKWTFDEDIESHSYGHPVIDIESKMYNMKFCPIWVMGTITERIAEEDIDLNGFEGIVEYWDTCFLEG